MSKKFNPLDYPACLDLPRQVEAVAWQEHIPFAMALIEMLRPKVLVELGVHKGDSYLAFCQAVSASNSDTACYGVDTWKGDAHAGLYGDEVLAQLRERHDGLYGKFSRLVQSTFDDAATYFQDGTVEVLHIDGFHTYEAVSHDWQVWQPKLTPGAVVLFHDINVRENGFGVWKLWQELSEGKPHFTFKHGHGLGVLAPGSQPPEALREFFALRDREAAAVEAFFFAAGNRITLHAAAQREAGRKAELERLGREQAQAARAQVENARQEQEREMRRAAELMQARERVFASREAELDRLRRRAAEDAARIQELEASLEEMASSTAVRAARLLRTVSPRLQGIAGAIGKTLMRGPGR